jgi:ribonuclease D
MSTLPEFLVAQPDELAPCLEHLATAPALGFDTEFVGEDSYHPRLCLVQVATRERLYLIDPLSVGPLEGFWRLLLDPARVVVVHAGREEVRLCKIATGQVPANLFDLQIGAGLVGRHYPLGHGALVFQLLGIQLPKGETLTEWRRRPLTPSQIRYAYDDVRYLLAEWDHVRADLESLGRHDWAIEEFSRLSTAAAPAQPSDEKWRKLRGLGSLDRKRLAVVRALFQWRETQAATSNRPARSILRDDLIIEIAKRGPGKAVDLQSLRGLARRDLEAIAAVAEEARALPSDQWPAPVGREQDPPQVTLLANILNAVLTDLCLRDRLAPSLVASTADVKAIVRGRLLEPAAADESILATGWRARHLLPRLQAILEGRTTLRIADTSADAPLEYGEKP